MDAIFKRNVITDILSFDFELFVGGLFKFVMSCYAWWATGRTKQNNQSHKKDLISPILPSGCYFRIWVMKCWNRTIYCAIIENVVCRS